MKKLLTCLTSGLIGLIAIAHPKADVFVEYNYHHPDNRGIMKNDKMTVLASPEQAKYFNETSLWVDSLKSAPGGEAQYKEIVRKSCVVIMPDGSMGIDLTKGPSKVISTFIFTEPEKETITVYDEYGFGENSYYTEPITEIQWNITEDSVKNILGYECIMAETDYHGRHWKAWFAPEIPLGFGPWKLRGLPGMILDAATNNGFSFNATAIGKTDRLMSPMYFKDKYQEKDRKKALKEFEAYINNIQSIVEAQSGGKAKVVWEDADGNPTEPIKFKAETHCIETDY